MKVSEEVLKQLNFRIGCLNGADGLVQMAQREFDLYMTAQLKELGLDTEKKKFNMNEKTGVISEVKTEPVKVGGDNASKES